MTPREALALAAAIYGPFALFTIVSNWKGLTDMFIPEFQPVRDALAAIKAAIISGQSAAVDAAVAAERAARAQDMADTLGTIEADVADIKSVLPAAPAAS